QAQAQCATRTMRQDKPPLPYSRVLVGIHHVMIAKPPPGIARLCLAVPAQLATRIHRLAELTNDLLGALGGQTRITALGPLLPARFARPLPGQPTDTVMPRDQVIPEACGLFAVGAEGGPFGCCAWHPRDLYRAIAHADGIVDRHSPVKWRPTAPLVLFPA